jgi:hypothetical protein
MGSPVSVAVAANAKAQMSAQTRSFQNGDRGGESQFLMSELFSERVHVTVTEAVM